MLKLIVKTSPKCSSFQFLVVCSVQHLFPRNSCSNTRKAEATNFFFSVFPHLTEVFWTQPLFLTNFYLSVLFENKTFFQFFRYQFLFLVCQSELFLIYFYCKKVFSQRKIFSLWLFFIFYIFFCI